jgi:hypothetical protein
MADCQIIFRSPDHTNGGCIFADPTTIIAIEAPSLPQRPSEGGGRRSERDSYRHGHRDALEQTRRKRILAEDDDIVALIAAMLTEGMM